MKPKCTRCNRTISGKIKIDTYRKKLGRKSLNKVEYYDDDCFSKLNWERSLNEHKKQETARKKRYHR